MIRECGETGVHGAIVISAGFKEIGPEGAELEQQCWPKRRTPTCASSGRIAWA